MTGYVRCVNERDARDCEGRQGISIFFFVGWKFRNRARRRALARLRTPGERERGRDGVSGRERDAQADGRVIEKGAGGISRQRAY